MFEDMIDSFGDDSISENRTLIMAQRATSDFSARPALTVMIMLYDSYASGILTRTFLSTTKNDLRHISKLERR
jgi:hypothetical protein